MGETKTVTFTLDDSVFEVVDESGRRFIPGGKYSLFAGVSQPDEISEKLGKPRCIKLETRK